MSDDASEDVLKMKQFLIDEGLYEAGMNTDSITQMYKTVNRSKQTEKNEIEYRELLSQTDLNCSSIDSLKPEVNDIDDTNKKTVINISTTPEKSAPIKSRKQPKRGVKTNIDFNFSTFSNYKTVELVTQRKNICPLLYHHPKILKLPTKDRAEIILLYLQNQVQQIRTDEIKAPVNWCQPIVPHPTINFNNDLCVENEPEFEDNATTEKSEGTDTDVAVRKTGRLVKRKNYGEDSDEELEILNKKARSNNTSNLNVTLEKFSEPPSTSSKLNSQKDDSDDDFFPTKSKKSKSVGHLGTVIVNKTTPAQKPNETTSKAKGKKWFPKLPKLFTPDRSDRTSKLFDKLRDEESKKPKANNVKLEDISDGSDDDIFPTTTNVSIHNETTPKLKKGKGKRNPTRSRKKGNINEESNATQIPVTNFYGKNKENELDASNNNKSITSNMVQCPICSRPFSNMDIEEHAASCDQFADSQTDDLCTICNKYVLNVDMDAHKFMCLEDITEASTPKTNDKNIKKLNSPFLCNICDTFVVDCSQLEHASNCIRNLNDG